MSDVPPSRIEASTEKLVESPEGKLKAGCILYVSEGLAADCGKSYRLEAGEAVIGSANDCELCLEDPAVSKWHLRFVVQSDGIDVRDLGSTNGSYYYGDKIQELRLQIGARFTLGESVVEVIPLGYSSIAPVSDDNEYGAMVGSSLIMRRLFGHLKQLETTDAPLLILGETGTGKELLAQAIADHSRRKTKPYVVVDCATLPQHLAASELFGHEKGAFTGAQQRRKGAFAKAEGGTLFLDEIGELSIDIQTHLLRVLESGEMKIVGSDTYNKVDVRVVAATHRDLLAFVKEGRFREDLYYRLSVFLVEMPPLRERREDILLLIQTLQERLGEAVTPLPPAAAQSFMQHSWPGNIRELRNAVHRYLVLGDLPEVSDNTTQDNAAPAQAMPLFNTDGSFRDEKLRVIMEFEREFLTKIWNQSENITKAAKNAGISRKQMRELLRKHKIFT